MAAPVTDTAEQMAGDPAPLTLAEVDGWVARAEGLDIARCDASGCYVHNPWRERNPTRYQPTRFAPTRNWSQGGPILELLVRAGLHVDFRRDGEKLQIHCDYPGGAQAVADTLLEAAMRCYVAAFWEDLCKQQWPEHA